MKPMDRFRNLPVRRKFTMVIVATTTVALFVSSVGVITWDQINFRNQLPRELQSLAGIVGANVQSALDFFDREAAEQTLANLRTEPHIASAAVYDASGAIFARYVRDPGTEVTIPLGAGREGYAFRGDNLEVFVPLMRDGELVGTLYLNSELTAVTERLRAILGIMAAVLVLTVTLALALSGVVQGLVTRPIVRLAEVARSVSTDQDFSVRASKESEDEVGSLIEAFNHMLAEIQARDNALQEARDNLERRVEERTSELTDEIAERQRTEVQLRIAKDDAEAAARAKSAFLATMSHEIRTPMNGVLGMTELVLDTELSEEQRDFVLTIQHSGEALLAVINDILDFSKVEAGKLAIERVDFDLPGVIEDAVDLLAPKAAQKRLTLGCMISPDVPRAVSGDPTRVRQVLLNLVGNAIKFTDAGQVELTAEVAREDGAEVVVRFNIRDSGIGMDEDTAARLFQPFTQADNSMSRRFGGTGLGLAISKRLTELMGGQIGVESVLGRGSRFWFTVRFLRRPEVRQDTAQEKVSLEGRRALVVDDHEINRRILVHHLESWGMRVTATGHPAEVLPMVGSAVREKDRFELLVIDRQMPDMSGFEVAALLKQYANAQPPRMILTASEIGPTDQVQAEELGFSAYLTKPFREAQLKQAVVASLGMQVQEKRDRRPQTFSPTTTTSGARVLLAEDNEVNELFAVTILQRCGCRVDVARDGLQALTAVERGEYDVIIMDCQMPNMDGYEATAHIRRLPGDARNTPIIAATAHAMEGDRERCLNAGMDDYVSKPFTPEELIAALEEWIPKKSRVSDSL